MLKFLTTNSRKFAQFADCHPAGSRLTGKWRLASRVIANGERLISIKQ